MAQNSGSQPCLHNRINWEALKKKMVSRQHPRPVKSESLEVVFPKWFHYAPKAENHERMASSVGSKFYFEKEKCDKGRLANMLL